MAALQKDHTIHADILIIGSGLAGLLLAFKLARSSDASVVIASKGALMESNSSYAQGGVAAATESNPFDSPDTHYLDTVKSGAGLTDAAAAREIIFGGARLIRELDILGVAFDKNGGGGYNLALEGGHKQARVLHSKDTTGRSITEALCAKIKQLSRASRLSKRTGPGASSGKVTILENTFALDLLAADGACQGAKLINEDGLVSVYADQTVLATGGLGQAFERTTNPIVATGDGIAMAFRAGARLADMEFVQFHPTALRLPEAPAFLISEAVRGAGATLLDHKGQRFVKRFHQDGELATRDIVARAIHSVMAENNLKNVYLDLQPIGAEAVRERFPNIVKTCAQFGIDVLSQPIPIAPAAHYMMGGIQTTVDGQTSIRGLSAIGECACNGMHGANRLASNSLLEAGVMALKLSDKLMSAATPHKTRSSTTVGKAYNNDYSSNENQSETLTVPLDLDRFRSQMYQYGGLVRSANSLNVILSASTTQTEEIYSPEVNSARNILQVGQLIARAASLRQESRGAHLRDDFAQSDDGKFLRRTWLSKSGSGWDFTGSLSPQPTAVLR